MSDNDVDDISGVATVNHDIERYYDPNGWLAANVTGYMSSGAPISMVTDQFSLTFNRSYTAVTDANGSYSFPNLPEGDYTIIIDKAPDDTPLLQDATSKTTSRAYTIRVLATPAQPRISVSPVNLLLGSARIGESLSKNLVVTNSGASDLVIGQISRPASPFQTISDSCSGNTLASAGSCMLSIGFTSPRTGSFYDIISVPNSDENYPEVQVYLSGDGYVSYLLPDSGRGESTRNPLSYTINSADNATDINTGLMWQRSGSPAPMNWAEAEDYCGNLTLDGYADWRLPNVLELVSIVNYGAANPAADTAIFPATRSEYYWSSFSGTGNTRVNPDQYAGAVNFTHGEAHPLDKTGSAYVRCVRGAELSTSLIFAGNGSAAYPYSDGLIATDQSTGLVWTGNPLTFGFNPYICDPFANCITLAESDACSMLTYRGMQGWRLPTVKELATLTRQFCIQDSCYTLSATPSTRADANGAFTNSLFFSPASDILAAPSATSHGVVCVKGGNRAWKISEPEIIDPGAERVTIRWHTEQPATGMVEYGETATYGASVVLSNLALEHAALLVNLKPATTYHYRIKATNAQGMVVDTEDHTFTTPAFSLKSLADSGNVALLETGGTFDAKKPDGTVNDVPRQAIAAEYIRTHADTFDFLVFLSTFDYALPENGAEGFYLPVKNDVYGINQPIFDYSARYGSNSKLQGTIDLGNISALAANPTGPLLENTVRLLSHELMHRFGAYVLYSNPDESWNANLLGKDSAHWSYLLDSKGSIMYGNGWKNNGDGTFTSVAARNGFSPLDLYLMGMIPKEQVPPMLLIDNPAIDKTLLPQLGATISGTAQTISIDDITTIVGQRRPDSSASQKKFNVGFVLLTKPGETNTAAVQAIELLRSAWAGRFAEMTNGIGGINGVVPSVSVTIDTPTDGTTVIGPDVTVSGTVINTTGAETGVTINGMPATVSGNRFIANHVPLQLGANNLVVTATDANGLTASTTRNITATTGDYIQISSNIESGTGPLNISLRLAGSFSIANPQVSYSGPVPVTLTPGTSSTEFTSTLSVEGTYTFTASAVGSDGQAYSDTVTVTVIPRYQLENLLKGKWEGMKAKVTSGNIQAAGAYFPLASRDMFLSLFNDTTIDSVSRLNDVTAVKIYRLSDYYAQGGLIRQDEDGLFSYPITFSKDELGLWRIYNY